MPLPDLSNPDYIKFFVESCEKTERLRLRWNVKHQEKLQKAAALQREDKGITDIEVLKVSMYGGLAAITRDFISSGYNRRRTPIFDAKKIPGIESLKKGHSIPEVGLGDPKDDPRLARPDTDLSIDPVMRPVDPNQTEILYKPKPDFGRVVYIKGRHRIKPEDKFYFSECSGWDYGWRLKDTPLGRNKPVCGRVFRLSRDGKSRSGPHRDPDHYKDPNDGC